jgi:hypothetical protein
MKATLIIALLCASPLEANDMRFSTTPEFIAALEKVETNGNPKAVGDNGDSFGILQIQLGVVRDVNRVHGTRYKHRDAFDPVKARDICRRYLSIYCTSEAIGREPTVEDAARIWNGGPKGWRKGATEGYWAKVKAVLAAKKSR